MVDASSSINGKDNFQLVKNFVTNMFHSFSLGGDVRYGLVLFGDKVQVNIYLINLSPWPGNISHL